MNSEIKLCLGGPAPLNSPGCLPTKGMQTPLLRSDHLDIKVAQCAENEDGHTISHHVISRLAATGVQKRRFGRPKIQFSSEVTKFAG